MGSHNPDILRDSCERAEIALATDQYASSSLRNEPASSPLTKPRRKLLLIDDDYVDRKAIIRVLDTHDHGFEIDEAESTSQALVFCDMENYDCILLELRLGETDTLGFLPRLKEAAYDGRMAIVLVTGMGNEYLAAQAFKAGVHDYLVKSNLQAEILLGAVNHAIHSVTLERQHERQKAELEYIDLHDHLTGLANRKLFLDRLDHAIERGKRAQLPFSLCSMDLDRFKQVNNTLGHEVGDMVLIEVARRLKQTLRSSDSIARFGGDEFAALLEVPNLEGTVMVAEKMIEAISKPIQVDNLPISIGLSIGISSFPDCGVAAKDLLKRADAAMFEAKKESSSIVIYSDNHLPDDQRTVP